MLSQKEFQKKLFESSRDLFAVTYFVHLHSKKKENSNLLIENVYFKRIGEKPPLQLSVEFSLVTERLPNSSC